MFFANAQNASVAHPPELTVQSLGDTTYRLLASCITAATKKPEDSLINATPILEALPCPPLVKTMERYVREEAG